MLRRLLGLSKAGQPYDGVVVRCNERDLVKWPGWYGVKSDGKTVDPKCPVEGNHVDGWVRL